MTVNRRCENKSLPVAKVGLEMNSRKADLPVGQQRVETSLTPCSIPVTVEKLIGAALMQVSRQSVHDHAARATIAHRISDRAE